MKKELFLKRFEEALRTKIDNSDWQTGASLLDVILLRTGIEDALRSVSVEAEITREHVKDCSAAIRRLPVSCFLGGSGVSEEAIRLASDVFFELTIPSVPVRVNVQPLAPPSYEQARCEQVIADAAYAHQVQEALRRGDEDGAARPPVILSVRHPEEAEELPPPYVSVEQGRRVGDRGSIRQD